MLIPVRDWWCPIVFFFIQVCFYYTGSVLRIIVIWKKWSCCQKIAFQMILHGRSIYVLSCVHKSFNFNKISKTSSWNSSPRHNLHSISHVLLLSLPVASFLHIGVRRLSPFTLSMNLQHTVYLNCTGFFLRKTPLSFPLYLMLIYREIWVWLYEDCIQRFGCTDTRKVAKKNISQDLQ